jgi:hypothetical protein
VWGRADGGEIEGEREAGRICATNIEGTQWCCLRVEGKCVRAFEWKLRGRPERRGEGGLYCKILNGLKPIQIISVHDSPIMP